MRKDAIYPVISLCAFVELIDVFVSNGGKTSISMGEIASRIRERLVFKKGLGFKPIITDGRTRAIRGGLTILKKNLIIQEQRNKFQGRNGEVSELIFNLNGITDSECSIFERVLTYLENITSNSYEFKAGNEKSIIESYRSAAGKWNGEGILDTIEYMLPALTNQIEDDHLIFPHIKYTGNLLTMMFENLTKISGNYFYGFAKHFFRMNLIARLKEIFLFLTHLGMNYEKDQKGEIVLDIFYSLCRQVVLEYLKAQPDLFYQWPNDKEYKIVSELPLYYVKKKPGFMGPVSKENIFNDFWYNHLESLNSG